MQHSQMFTINRIKIESRFRCIFRVFPGHFYCMRGPSLVELIGDDSRCYKYGFCNTGLLKSM